MENLDGVKDIHIEILHPKDPFEGLEKEEPIELTD